jgi:glycosyltransferase involved in cell wall biosynthesis
VISVIVPVYNAEKTIRRCVESVLRRGWELVLVNDGSTDKSGAICDEYKNQAHVVHTLNNGPGWARNIGMNKATGDYITFVDADDYLDGSNFSTSRLNDVQETYLYLQKPYLNTTMANLHGKLFYRESGVHFDPTMRLFEDVDFMYRYLATGEYIFSFRGYVQSSPQSSMKAYCCQQAWIGKAFDSIGKYNGYAKTSHAYACVSIVHLVRGCHRVDENTIGYVKSVIRSFDYSQLKEYKRARGHSVLIPLFLRLGLTRPLMWVCHAKAKGRYG